MNGASLICAVRGPVLLITIGTLVELDYMGVAAFSRTWPVLIILFGVLKLLERAFVRPVQYPGARPPGGNVI